MGIYFFLGSATTIILILFLVVSVIIVAIVGALLYRITIHQILGDEVAVMVVTVCIALILQEVIKLRFGFPPVPVGWPPESSLRMLRNILGVTVSNAEILAALSSLAVFVLLFVLIKRTKIGKAMTAVSQDREAAMLMGVNTNRLYMLTMAISAMLAGIAGILITTSTTMLAYPFMWMQPLFSAFSIVILGGLGSIKGSLIGSFIIAYSEIAFAIFVDSPIAGVAPLSIMVIVLLLRPKGLFGKRVEMED
jgi:branched-chain amino acid transport system permease protein